MYKIILIFMELENLSKVRATYYTIDTRNPLIISNLITWFMTSLLWYWSVMLHQLHCHRFYIYWQEIGSITKILIRLQFEVEIRQICNYATIFKLNTFTNQLKNKYKILFKSPKIKIWYATDTFDWCRHAYFMLPSITVHKYWNFRILDIFPLIQHFFTL